MTKIIKCNGKTYTPSQWVDAVLNNEIPKDSKYTIEKLDCATCEDGTNLVKGYTCIDCGRHND
jgi:hypothetical protein